LARSLKCFKLAERGVVALGVPRGTPTFVQAHLHAVLARQRGLLDNLPALHHSQVAWLLLSCCAAPRAQYALRTLPLESAHGYAAGHGHDGAVIRCLASLLFDDEGSQMPQQAQARAQLALRHGGLGLRSATRHAPAAYWASWADALRTIARRDPDFMCAGSLASDRPLPLALHSTRDARASLSRCMLKCQPSLKKTRPLTSLAVASPGVPSR